MTLRQSIERYQRVMASSDDPAHASIAAALSEILTEQIEGRPKLDTRRMRACSPLLPAPGDEVVRECLDEIESLQSELSASRAECERLRDAAKLFIAYDDMENCEGVEFMRAYNDAITATRQALEPK